MIKYHALPISDQQSIWLSNTVDGIADALMLKAVHEKDTWSADSLL